MLLYLSNLFFIFFPHELQQQRPVQHVLLLYYIHQNILLMEWSGGIRRQTSAAGSCRAAAAPLRGDALLAAMQ